MWLWAKYALRWVTKWSLFLPSYFSFKSDFNFLPVFLKEIPLLPFSISAKKGAKTSRDRSQIHSPSNITGIFLALWKHRYCKATSSLRIQSLKKMKQNKTKKPQPTTKTKSRPNKQKRKKKQPTNQTKKPDRILWIESSQIKDELKSLKINSFSSQAENFQYAWKSENSQNKKILYF